MTQTQTITSMLNEKNTGWKRRFWSTALIVVDTGDSGRGVTRGGVEHLYWDGDHDD